MNNYLDLNQVRFYNSQKESVGTVETITINADNIVTIAGRLDNSQIPHDGKDILLVVDRYHRYLHHNQICGVVPENDQSRWEIQLSLSHIMNSRFLF